MNLELRITLKETENLLAEVYAPALPLTLLPEVFNISCVLNDLLSLLKLTAALSRLRRRSVSGPNKIRGQVLFNLSDSPC